MSETELGSDILSDLGLRLFPLYALFGTPTQQWDITLEDTRAVLAKHVSYLRELERTGVMFMGGPFRAPDYAWNGSGMIIVRADTLASAQALADRDPLHVHGLRSYEVRGWQLNEGRLVLSLDLDSNTIDLA